MLAISVMQPVASLLSLGLVRWNERTWATGHRGRIWLHASESLQDRAWALWAVPEVRSAFRARSRVLELPDAPRGCVIASVHLVACIPVPDLARSGHYPTALDGRVNRLDDRSAVLVFKDPRPLARPVYCRGGAGLFEVDPRTAERLRPSLRDLDLVG